MLTGRRFALSITPRSVQMNAVLQVRNLEKRFGQIVALDDVNLSCKR